LLAAVGSGPDNSRLTPALRAGYQREIERARYQFVIGNTTPFDEAYPLSVFERRVEREMAQERVLENSFGLTVTPELLAQEFDRIEKATKAPEQWESIKKALGNDRHLIEKVFCRPLLVDRALRSKFAFDQKIHAAQHRKARQAREGFLAGKTPRGAQLVVARRKGEPSATTDELLGRAKQEAALPRALSPPKDAVRDAPMSFDPEVAEVLERELKRPGDVTTILEERDCFEVFRLIASTEDSWKLEAVRFPKLDFDSWLDNQIRKIPQPIR